MPPKGRRAAEKPGREWGHPDGKPLTEVEVDAECNGVVTNVGPFGVFVDFGAVKDGLLRVPAKVARQLKKGAHISGMVVVSCDPDAEKVVLDPPPEMVASSADARPLEDLEEGEALEGTVANVSPYGVFVDVGAVKDARLAVSTAIGRRFRIGDVISDCKLEAIDLEKRQLTVSIPDPEEVVKDLPPKERPGKAKSTVARSASPTVGARQRKQKSWAHEGARPLEDVQEGEVFAEGRITNVSVYGVFVDVGTLRDARLDVSREIGSRFRIGDVVQDLKVESVDVERGRMSVSLPDPEAAVKDLPPKEPRTRSPAPPRGKAKARARSTPAAASGARQREGSQAARPKRDWAHAGATELEDLQEGQVFEGRVANVSPYGVFVDIGAVKDARLSVSKKVGRRFRIGDTLSDCKLESLDLEGKRLVVSIPDPEEATRDLAPKPRAAAPAPSAKAAGNAKAKAKAKGRASSQPLAAARAGQAHLEDLEVGAFVDGIVTNTNQFGVFVDIGCGKDAKLNVSKKVGAQFRRGDEICGMQIEDVDLEKRQISVTVEDPELAEGEEEEPPEEPKANAKAKSKAKAKAKSKASSASPRPQAGGSKTPASCIKVGSVAQGVVTKIDSKGVHVDIGASADGLLAVSRALARQFRPSDEVHGMIVEEVDVKGGVVHLSLEEPQLSEPDPAEAPGRPPQAAAAKAKAKAKAEAKPAAKAKAKAKAKAGSEPDAPTMPSGRVWSQPGGKALADLRVGSEVSGSVTSVGSAFALLDIGAVKGGRLHLPKKDLKKFELGDWVEGMIIDNVNLQTEQITLILPYQLGDEPEEWRPPPGLQQPLQQQQAPTASARASGASRRPAGSGASPAQPTEPRRGPPAQQRSSGKRSPPPRR